MSLYHTPYCIATHILTAVTTPVTSTPLLTNICISSTLPVRAAFHILLFSSYNNITDNNIILLIHIYMPLFCFKEYYNKIDDVTYTNERTTASIISCQLLNYKLLIYSIQLLPLLIVSYMFIVFQHYCSDWLLIRLFRGQLAALAVQLG